MGGCAGGGVGRPEWRRAGCLAGADPVLGGTRWPGPRADVSSQRKPGPCASPAERHVNSAAGEAESTAVENAEFSLRSHDTLDG